MKVLLIGASRGIGFELARQYMAAGDSVTGTARDDAGLVALRGLGAHAIELDVAAEASAAQLERGVGTDVFDRVVFCAGVYGPSAHRWKRRAKRSSIR